MVIAESLDRSMSCRGELVGPTRIAFLATSKVPANKGMGRALGIETLGGFLQKNFGDTVAMQFIDLQYEGDADSAVDALIADPTIDILGISVRYATYGQMEQILARLSAFPRIQREKRPFVVVGGVMPSFTALEIVGRFPFASVVKGEGELAMLELTRTIRSGGSLHEVSGLTFFDEGSGAIISNPPRNVPLPEISSGTIIPDLIPKLVERRGIVWVSGSRGCPWDCNFCSVSAFREMTGANGKARREMRPVEDIIGELRALYNLGARAFVFADDEMLVGTPKDLKRWHALAEGVKTIGDDISLECSVRSDVIWNKDDKDGGHARREAFHALVDAGLSHVYIGFESGSPTQLRRYNKGEDVETHFRAIEILREEGVLVGGGFIMFDPLMNLKEIEENIAFLRKAELISHNRRDYVGDIFDMLRVQRGARYLDMLSERGLLGDPIPQTLFYTYRFEDSNIQHIAETCIGLAAEVDDFFEALKTSILSSAMVDDAQGIESPGAKLLQYYITELRLLDLSLLEDLVNATKEKSDATFEDSVGAYRRNRRELLATLKSELQSSEMTDRDSVQVLISLIDRVPDFQELI